MEYSQHDFKSKYGAWAAGELPKATQQSTKMSEKPEQSQRSHQGYGT